MRVGIVIPTLDEEASLRRHLRGVLETGAAVVVSDGGSRDGTLEVAAGHGVPVVTGPAGRGRQLNLGAAALETPALLFLHADTTLPPGALDEVERALAGGAVGGGFRVRFDSPRPIFRLGSAVVNLRTRLTRRPLGDQAQFVRRDAFEAIGGFRDWPILEDLDLMRRLGRRGRLAVLPPAVRTSPRRFVRRGLARTVATNWLIFALFFAGVSPHRLAGWYRRVR